jgi:hemin uptake protein HemP
MLIVYFQNLLQNEHYIIIDFQQQELFLEATQFLTASTMMSEPSRL